MAHRNIMALTARAHNRLEERSDELKAAARRKVLRVADAAFYAIHHKGPHDAETLVLINELDRLTSGGKRVKVHVT